MKEIVLLLHNIRSTHNVGSIMRTAEGFGVKHICFSGYTPYPDLKLSPDIKIETKLQSDSNLKRLPHITEKLTKQISKTALDAEKLLPFTVHEHPPLAIFKADGYRVVALEQTESSVDIANYTPKEKTLLILGEEVDGINLDLLKEVEDTVEIPMLGLKESFNVSVAAGIALYAFST